MVLGLALLLMPALAQAQQLSEVHSAMGRGPATDQSGQCALRDLGRARIGDIHTIEPIFPGAHQRWHDCHPGRGGGGYVVSDAPIRLA